MVKKIQSHKIGNSIFYCSHCRNRCCRRRCIRRVVRQHSSNHHRHCGLCSRRRSIRRIIRQQHSWKHHRHCGLCSLSSSSQHSTDIFVAHDAYDGYIRSIRLVAVSVSTSSFDSRLFLYHHRLIIIFPILISRLCS